MTAASSPLSVRRAHTSEPDPDVALAVLRKELDTDSASAVLLYCSGGYDLQRLGSTIAETFASPVIACTACSQIGPDGFQGAGITGISLQSGDLSMHPHLLSPLSLCQSQAGSIAKLHALRGQHRPNLRSFGVLLVDGTALWEEFVASALYESLGNVPVVGGSAAPPAPQAPAAVYHQGRFHRDAAVIALFETSSLQFSTFAAQHFVPTNKKLVITLANPDRRLVYEINGEPATKAYAKALQIDEARLTEQHFACHPLMLNLGDQRLPRAIRAIDQDGSLLMACAIEEGLVLSIAESSNALASIRDGLTAATQRVRPPLALLVFDSHQHRLQLEAQGLGAQVSSLLAQSGAVGFSGYGAQLGPLHTNHTLTGIALGAAAKGHS